MEIANNGKVNQLKIERIYLFFIGMFFFIHSFIPKAVAIANKGTTIQIDHITLNSVIPKVYHILTQKSRNVINPLMAVIRSCLSVVVATPPIGTSGVGESIGNPGSNSNNQKQYNQSLFHVSSPFYRSPLSSLYTLLHFGHSTLPEGFITGGLK
jgi:hypothetical protein